LSVRKNNKQKEKKKDEEKSQHILGSLRAPDKKRCVDNDKTTMLSLLNNWLLYFEGWWSLLLIDRGSNIVYCVCLMVKTGRKSPDARGETWLGC
jgi:hypothetical protein